MLYERSSNNLWLGGASYAMASLLRGRNVETDIYKMNSSLTKG